MISILSSYDFVNLYQQHSEASREGSDSDDEYGDTSMDEELEFDSDESSTDSPPLLTVGDVQRALHPLQATADRVGKQVEEFAETLDRLSTRKQRKDHKDCRHVLPLVLSYRKIAHDTVEELTSIHSPDKQRQMTKRWKRKLRSSSGGSTPRSTHSEEDLGSLSKTTVEDLKRWEQEEQTWDLLGRMLQVEYPVPQPDAQDLEFNEGFMRPNRGPDVHRYSPEKDVWARFLAEDDLAWERHTVVEWLKKCADSSGQEIELVVKELEFDAERGTGIWADSWLYTKEAIKGQKLLRSWPQALDPEAPGIGTSLLNADRTQGLITQLDPDAITRQGRNLEKKDQYFETAMWLACWEMLRRGKNWDYVRDWCRERVEGWRAVAMRGDPRSSDFKETQGDTTSLAASWLTRALWRKTCAVAAKRGGVDKYENAVYGILSGYLPSVKEVIDTWDDYLFAHYNSYLLRQFDRYVTSNFPDRLAKALVEKHGCFKISVAAGHRTNSGNQIITRMKTLQRTGKEAREPLKALQGSLIAKAFDGFLHSQGIQLALSANHPEKSKILPFVELDDSDTRFSPSITMDDYDLLRIITHTLFIFQDLGLDIGDGDRRIATENFVVAYVDYLSKAGKQQLLPLYASRLSSKRTQTCLGRQLVSIRDHGERQTMIRLMKQNGIDVNGVLNMQLQLIITDNPPDQIHVTNFPRLHVLETTKDDRDLVHPIRKDFIGDFITDDEQDLINAFEWYLLVEGHWQQTVSTGTVLYKHLLRTKSLAAARELSKSVTFSNISLSKTQAILGRTQDISQTLEVSDDEAEHNTGVGRTRSRQGRGQRRRRSSSARRAHNERQLLLEQSRSFRDFEALFAILDAIEEWKKIADEVSTFPDPRQDARAWKTKLPKAYERVETLMYPLLHGWLQYPENDAEATEFEQIRVACLPELVLAYNAIVNHGGYYISRDILLKSMDLAALVAEEESDLAACFSAAGRMPELVDSLALSSRNMIQAEEQGSRGGKGKSKRKLDGASLGLWAMKAAPPP
ncbi:Nucleoporin nup84 [Lobaria immixta]|nr:Nucleoporin nup84 [Lobaria immixta]